MLIAGVVVAIVSPNEFVLWTLLALLFAGIGLTLTWSGFAFLVDAIDGRVGFVTGRLILNMVTGKTTSYFADCGPVKKRISRRAYDSLPRGATCHLYYAPGSRSLLSIESATVEEPKPGHPFGPDSAHAWDRLRWSWVGIAVGALGLLVAAYGVAVAHPARPIKVGGTVANYNETHYKSTTHRYLYLEGDSQAYEPDAEGAYSPPAPPFGTLMGKEVVLYVDEGTPNVLAINDGDQLYAGDWYLHTENERTFQIRNSLIVGAVGLIILGTGAAPIVLRRSRASVAPPTVRPLPAMWAPVSLVLVVGAVFWIVLAVASHR